jgi:uncharacterized membrane protein YozB (DUF420 family)
MSCAAKRGAHPTMLDTLPAINATLNGVSTILLIVAYISIRRKRYTAHGALMVAAFCTSTVFLALYLYHKYLLHQATGSYNVSTAGYEPAWLRMVYLLVLLLPHLILAIVMLPLIGLTFYFAARRRWAMHTRFSRPTFWIWLYVSITGVLIYFMLYHVMRVES